MIEDVVRTEEARLVEFRPEFSEIADELGQDAHVEPARHPPPVDVEHAEQADANQTRALVPFTREALQVARQMRGGRLLVHRRADHMQSADTAVVQRVERRIGVFGATRRMGGVDDGGDASIERGDRSQLGAEIHVPRPVMRAQRLGDDVDIGEEIVHVRHQAAHDAEPHMMVGVHQARHDDGAGSVDRLGTVPRKVRTNGRDAATLDQNIAGRQIGNSGIHRDDRAAFEKCAAVLLRAHDRSPFGVGEFGPTVIALRSS